MKIEYKVLSGNYVFNGVSLSKEGTLDLSTLPQEKRDNFYNKLLSTSCIEWKVIENSPILAQQVEEEKEPKRGRKKAQTQEAIIE